jgi:adenylosuccinate synthase
MVVRTFPIRVGGNSGPLANEITWDILQEETHGYVSVPERTTVTKKVRRIARIDYDLLARAVLQTCPTNIALTFLDYIIPDLAGCGKEEYLHHDEAQAWVKAFENRVGVPLFSISTGPGHTFEVD